MSKRLVIMVVCVISVVGALLALTGLRGKSQPLASFTYLGTVTNLAGRSGRFSISNCCDAPIHYIPGLVEFYSSGKVCRASSPGSPNMGSNRITSRLSSSHFLQKPGGGTAW